MKDIITITEMSKLRNITTETLRHYDRIGLFKPIYVDPKTNYRFYSILQYEKLGTIMELRQLGLSLGEIKDYFDNRNINNSMNLLIQKKIEVDAKIKELKELQNIINHKLGFLSDIVSTTITEDIRVEEMKTRTFIAFDHKVNDDVELSYDAVRLEGLLHKVDSILPIFATNRYGGIISRADIESGVKPLSALLVIQCEGKESTHFTNTIKVPGGKFVCKYHEGTFWDRGPSIEKLMDYITENGYQLTGDIIQMQWVDYSITDNLDEISFEFQAPIK